MSYIAPQAPSPVSANPRITALVCEYTLSENLLRREWSYFRWRSSFGTLLWKLSEQICVRGRKPHAELLSNWLFRQFDPGSDGARQNNVTFLPVPAAYSCLFPIRTERLQELGSSSVCWLLRFGTPLRWLEGVCASVRSGAGARAVSQPGTKAVCRPSHVCSLYPFSSHHVALFFRPQWCLPQCVPSRSVRPCRLFGSSLSVSSPGLE